MLSFSYIERDTERESEFNEELYYTNRYVHKFFGQLLLRILKF